MKKILLTSFIIAGLMIATSAMAALDDSSWTISAWKNTRFVIWDTWVFKMDNENLGTIDATSDAEVVDVYGDGVANAWSNWRGKQKVTFRFPNEQEIFYGTIYTEPHSGSEIILGVVVDYLTGIHGIFLGAPTI